MKFPLIKDIANRDMVSIAIDCSISEALDKMLQENHRNLIVLDENDFKIITIVNILNFISEKVSFDSKLSELNLETLPTIRIDKDVRDTLHFLNDAVEYVCAVNLDKSLFGVVTNTDISSNIDPDTLMDNYRLEHFLRLSKRMKWVSKEEKTSTLLKSMIDGQFDNVIVVENRIPIGILTTKDVIQLVKNKADLEQSISNYMISPVLCITQEASIKEALAFIKENNFRRVVVVDDNNELLGIVTQKELISLTYSKWAMLMKDYQEELTELNSMLESKSKEYEARASRDALTGLYNRYKFSELYVSSYTSMLQRKNDMSLIIIDIDFFKKVNDTYGHNIGDNALIELSNALLKTLRNIDVVCRWGGEEFVVLLPTANLETSIFLANKIRTFIESIDIEIIGSITVSCGVSQVRSGESMEDAISRADKALYLAKESGRNCVKSELDT